MATIELTAENFEIPIALATWATGIPWNRTRSTSRRRP